MFVNCPSCRGLVATDPATDEPPERCPRCASRLRGTVTPTPADDARSGVAAAIAEHVGALDATAADPADTRAAQPALSIATLLQAEPATPLSTASADDVDVDGAEADVAPAGDSRKEPDATPARATPSEPGATPAPDSPEAVDTTPAPASPAEPDVTPLPAPAAEPADAPALPARREDRRAAPSFVRRRRGDSASPARRWPMLAAIAALSLLLGLQWLLADRARLAADPGWRPVVERACALLRCTLPPWRDATAFTLLERDVRPHPTAANGLRVTASFRNDADWPQAWPELVLTLSDIDGRPLAMRAFTAAEYLGGAPPSPLLASGQGAMVHMDVVEPGPRAVSYSFDFR